MLTFILILNIPLNTLTLADEQSLLQQIQRGFNTPTTLLSLNWLIIIFVSLLCAAITIATWKWKIKDEKHLGKTYRSLAVALNLNWYDRTLLNKTAINFGLINGSGMIISQGTFDYVISKLNNNKNNNNENEAKLNSKQIARLNQIRARLFAE